MTIVAEVMLATEEVVAKIPAVISSMYPPA